jgi:hypothetical protein
VGHQGQRQYGQRTQPANFYATIDEWQNRPMRAPQLPWQKDHSASTTATTIRFPNWVE